MFKSKKKIKKSQIVPIIFPEKGNIYNETKCVICYTDFNDDSISLPCSHVFHSACILTWFEKKMECPFCKTRMTWTTKKERSVSIDNTDDCE
jgi:hypothetical protein